MKYKALLLGFLLLLPVGLIATLPRGNSSQFVQPSLYITPPITKFFGPSLMSTYFPIDVILWNNPLSGVDVYAFDFTLNWPCDGYLTFVNATYHSPFASSFVIANGNTTMCPYGVGLPEQGQPNNWHLAITAIPPSTGLTNVTQSVLRVWFHIDQEVCYPFIDTGNFTLTNVTMSGDGTVPVPIVNVEIDNGNYTFSAPQPNIDLITKDPAFNGTMIVEKCVSHTFDVEVDLSNVTNVYGFGFDLVYDPNYLETDAQHITIKAAFPPPYEELIVNTPPISLVPGLVTVVIKRPSEKPTVQADGLLPAVDVVFHTVDNVYNPPNNLPTPALSNITITRAYIFVKCPNVLEYDYGPGSGSLSGNGLLLFGGNLTYYFKPSMYDLNEDCVVDIQDLMALLPYYGKGPYIGGFGSIFNTPADLAADGGFVDVFDFVAIAKHFGPVDP